MLRAYKDYGTMCDDIFYLAPSGQTSLEVDFILTRGSNLIGIEAKSGRIFKNAWCKGLRVIKPLTGLQRRIIVYLQGPAMRTKDGIDVLPFKQFCDELATNSHWKKKA